MKSSREGKFTLDYLSAPTRERITEEVATYLREVLGIDLARQHAQAALGLPVDEV